MTFTNEVDDRDADLIHFNQKQLERRYGISKSLFRRAISTGYINNVLAPNIIKKNSSYVVTLASMNEYEKRVQTFDRMYLTYDGLGKALRWNHYNKELGSFNGRKQMYFHGHYMRIKPPPAYFFIKNRRKYFHTVDVELMRSAVAAVNRSELPADAAHGFDRETGLWTPRYLMPLDEEYKTQYKQETMQLIESWHVQRLHDEHYQAQLPFDLLLE